MTPPKVSITGERRKRGRKLVPLPSLEIAKAYEAGATLKQLEHDYHTSMGRISECLRLHQVKSRPRGNVRGCVHAKGFKVGQERYQEIAARFTARETLQSIANDMGVTRERIRQIVLMMGLPPARIRRRAAALVKETARQEYREQLSARREDALNELVNLWSSGLSLREMAEATGHSLEYWNARVGIMRACYPRLLPYRLHRTPLPERALRNDYARGMNLKQLSRKYKRCVPFISRQLTDMGVVIRSGFHSRPSSTTQASSVPCNAAS